MALPSIYSNKYVLAAERFAEVLSEFDGNYKSTEAVEVYFKALVSSDGRNMSALYRAASQVLISFESAMPMLEHYAKLLNLFHSMEHYEKIDKTTAKELDSIVERAYSSHIHNAKGAVMSLMQARDSYYSVPNEKSLSDFISTAQELPPTEAIELEIYRRALENLKMKLGK